MSLKLDTTIEEVFPHQNPAFASQIKMVAGYEEITVNATTQDIAVDVYETRFTTGAASSVAKLPAGAYIGQRKVIKCKALGTAGDALVLTPASGVTWKQSDGTTACASVTFSAANKYLLVEWNGARWTNIATDGTVA